MDAYTYAEAEGEGTWFNGNLMLLKATAESTNGAYGLVDSWLPAGQSPPLHIHHREDEAFYVLEGELTFQVGDTTLTAGPGSYTFAPRGIPHTFVVESDGAHVLTLISPGGGERYFVDAGRPPEREGLPPAGPPDIESLKRYAEAYGNEIVGPPLKPRAHAGVS
jgi:quercetin dioxygenase-like cupin family protein